MDVHTEEAAEVFRCGRDLMLNEKFASQTGVRASGELQLARAIGNLEFSGESAGKRFDTRSAAVDERAVNVEQDEANHAQG
jgi:hypothetical protein